MSSLGDRYYNTLPGWILAGQIEPEQECELYTGEFDLPHFKDVLRQLYPDLGEPIEQNITCTLMWLSFVANSWHCFGGVFDKQWWSSLDQQIQSSNPNKMTLGMIAFVVCIVACCIFAFLVVVCKYICCGVIRMKSRKEYGEMMTSFHEDHDYGNGHDNSEYDGDDEDDDNNDDPPVQIV